MNNFDFLKKYYSLQKGIMFDKLKNLEFAIVSYCNIYDSPFWNSALTDQVLSENQINETENVFSRLKRSPTFYFENKIVLKDLVTMLTNRMYKKRFEDSWQFWNETRIDNKHFKNIKKVESAKDLDIFLETFNDCYQNNDPQNPYGELGDYLKVAKDSWRKHNAQEKLEYFLVFKDNLPVAVSTLTNFEGLGYISNVGSLRKVRGEGYGKAATLYCIRQSINNGNSAHCLATEEGCFPNEFYKRIGFKTRFTAVGYTKSKPT